MVAAVGVIRRAIELGCNLIVVHEPTNYTSADRPGWQEDFKNDVFAEKAGLLAEHGITVWRDHDHMHFHQPDGIFTGVLKYLGWENDAVADRSMGMFTHYVVTLPPEKQTNLRALLARLKETVGLSGIRFVDLVKKGKRLFRKQESLPEDYGKHIMYLFANDFVRIYDRNGKVKLEGYYKAVKNLLRSNLYFAEPNKNERYVASIASKDIVEKVYVGILGKLGGEISCSAPLPCIGEKSSQ